MIHAQQLFRAYRTDPRRTVEDIREAFQRGRRGEAGGLAPQDFSLRDLASQFIVDTHGEPIGLTNLEHFCRGEGLMEADGALTPSAFATITGQIVNVAVMEGYELPEFVLSGAVRTIKGNAEQARLTGVSVPGDDDKDLEITPGQEYPAVGLYEEYVKTPTTVKRGAIVRVTKETILQDAGDQVLDQARQVGELIGLKKEKKLIDYVIGATSSCVIEKRVGDSAEQTLDLFYATGESTRYVNEQVNALADWTDIDAAENLFLGITMPGTGESPMLNQRFLLAPPQLRSTASRVLNATETRSGTSNVVVASNPISGLGLRLMASSLVYNRLVASGVEAATAKQTWFYGDLARAFRYYENWPLTVEQERTGALSFTHDVLAQFKASEKGTPVVLEPRVWSKQTPS